MPVKTGIQELRGFLDTGLRRYDVYGYFSDSLLNFKYAVSQAKAAGSRMA
jgi:hypothetical protein